MHYYLNQLMLRFFFPDFDIGAENANFCIFKLFQIDSL